MKLRSQRRLAGALHLGALLVMTGCAGLGLGSQQRTITLFDGTSLEGWEQAGPGRFVLQPDGSIVSEGGMGLLYYAERPFRDYVLELEWKAERDSVNSGIFLRFPEKTDDPWTAVRTGYEIQIDPTAKDPINRTGAVYDIAAPFKDAAKPTGEWNQYRIEVTGQRYQVYLNGEKVNDFFGDRGREGFIGLQNHDPNSPVAFRNIRVTPVDAEGAPESLAELFQVEDQRAPVRVLVLTATTGWRHKEAIEATKQVLPKLDQTTEFDFTITEDVSALNQQNLAQYDLVFLANSTIRVAERDNQDERGMKPGGNHNEPAPALTRAQEQALLGFVRSGKGLVVAHSGLDALYGSTGYLEAVGGGLFESHPWTQSVGIKVEDRSNPATAHLGEGFHIRDEIYVLDKNPRWNSHVLLSLDMRSVQGDSMSADPTRDDYPISWIRRYGQGRVFVTKLGHFADVWNNPAFVEHLLQGMRIAAGRVEADFGGRRVKETIATDVWPDDIVVDDRGNVWIAELTGRILRYDAQTKQTTPVAQLNTTDPTNIEHGLLGIEVDPEFYAGKPYVYAFYTVPEAIVNTLSRFEYRNGQIDLSTEKVLLRVPTDPQCCHQAGDLEWGPNGTIFVSTGDTGQSGTKPDQEITEARINAFVQRNDLTGYHWSRLADSERTSQNLQDLRGKILRINKDGSIPKDNPFYGEPGVRWEIYVYGLRNPYRFKYDAPTGRLFIGIVGPDEQTTYDWYDVSTKGGENFGWPRATGRLFYNEWTPEMIPNYVPPVWEYTYATGGRSATGGPIYRHEGEGGFPEVFQGKAFLYDWSRKWIKWGELVEDATFTNDTIADVKSAQHVVRMPAIRLQNVKTFDVLEEGTSPISMELGPDGCLYLAEFTGFWKPAPGAKVTRYCWREDATPDTGAQGR